MSKNAFCLAGVVFSEQFLDGPSVAAALQTFVAFCAASSAVYILNDIVDRDRDRAHPTKRFRPLASGIVPVWQAAGGCAVLAAAALALTSLLGVRVLTCLGLYLVNNLAYSFLLKHVPLLDVLSIALGFVLRLLAGVYAVADVPTTWITLCTFFLAVFLGFAKRRAELHAEAAEPPAGDGAAELPAGEEAQTPSPPAPYRQRPVLSEYSVQFLDYLVNLSAVMAVMCYALFTAAPAKNPTLVLTVPIVYYAIMHYYRQVVLLRAGQEPEELLFKDVPLLLSIALWLVTYFGISLGNLHWFR